MAASPFVPLALGAGALWLLSQLKLGGGGIGTSQGGSPGAGGPIPPNQQPGAGSGGGGGGVTPGEIQATIGAGATIIGGGIGLATHLIGGAAGAAGGGGAAAITAGAGAGAGAGGAGAGAGGAAGGAAGAAETGAEVGADVAIASELSAGAAAGVTAFFVLPILAAEAMGLALQSEGDQENKLDQLEVYPSSFSLGPGFNRWTMAMLNGEIGFFDSGLTKIIGDLNVHAPPFPDLNQIKTAFDGFGGYRGFGRFGVGTGLTPLPGGLTLKRNVITNTTQNPIVQNLPANDPLKLVSSGSFATMPDPNTPYGFTRCDVLNDPSCGMNSPDPTIAAYSTLIEGYYINSIDPRLPTKILMRSRAFYRWMLWTVYRQMNACLRSYYTYKDKLSGCFHSNLTWGGCCNVVDANGNCADRTAYSMDPGQFETDAATFFTNFPDAMQPQSNVPKNWNNYQTLNGAAAVFLDAFNKAQPAGGPKQDFNKFAARLTLLGTAQAARQSSYIGFGTGIQWSTGWPGDDKFTGQMMDALGLTNQGWGWGSVYAPDIGPNPVYMAQDPVTGFWLDFVGMHNNGGTDVRIYQDAPGTQNALDLTQVDASTIYDPSKFLGRFGRFGDDVAARLNPSMIPVVQPVGNPSMLPLVGLLGAGAALWYLTRKKGKALSGYRPRSRRKARSRR